MRKIVLLTKDSSLKRELLSALPEGYSRAAQIPGPRSVVFFDIDTLKAGDIREMSRTHFVIAVTKQKRTDQVMEAATFGAYETVLRPLKKETLGSLLDELHDMAEEMKTAIAVTSPPPSASTCVIVGHSLMIMDVCKRLARLSQVDVPVLITGETGTGKELIAESIAQLSSRFGKPFVVVNCAAVPETLLESELFGFEKGSFTGAIAAKEGILKIADEGCVFFDEVGELPLALQGKLLRFLQTQTFYPIGSTREVQVNVRVISATNRDLPAMVEEGRFREDLYHRLRVASIHIPPLRERKKDIPPLVHFFLNRYRHTAPRPIEGVTKEFLKRMVSHDWPGNIRELENTIRSALALSKTHYLTTHELKELGSHPSARTTGFSETLSSALIPSLKEAIEKKERNIYATVHREVDRVILDYIVSHTRENQSLAARLLGINRLTLRKKLGLLR